MSKRKVVKVLAASVFTAGVAGGAATAYQSIGEKRPDMSPELFQRAAVTAVFMTALVWFVTLA